LKAPNEVETLVANFKLHEETLKHSHYSEISLCTDYLNTLFESLGWDVTNKNGYSESYRDVIQQFRQKVGSSNKAPDYLFRTGATPIFFLEAKKPSVNILKDKTPAYQLRTYGWNNKGVDISVLSDFEHLAIYDVRIKPKEIDEPHVGRLVKFHYTDYLEKWNHLYDLLARESICKGSLENLLKSGPTKGTKETVDESFLKVIESWREELAKNIANRNPSLTVHELNRAVQMTIDRIVFLRNCEDRNIEPDKQLLKLVGKEGIYKHLLKLFDKADTKYNSGLFHLKNDKTRQTGKDELTPKLTVDDKTLKVMIEDLYPPKNPFDFSIMPVDILGQVYERFLGKVIRLTDSHRAKVEEKPEVRKAGGVYYTPKYIVDYIIKNTVGKLVEGKTPDQVAKLRILDPACGSGSFLLGAYQYLLSWHLDWYTANEPRKFASKKKNPPICEITGGWKLTTEKRKEILLNNIYGVDIDRQAVEVAKLNLLLKVLENQEVSLGMERALPDLGENIKCGNSLIGTDFYDDKQSLLTDPEERYRINAFDWEEEFPQIIKWKDKTKRELEDGFGFDGVVGNPPYIFTRGKSFDDFSKDYYSNRYFFSNYQINTYCLFIEIADLLLKNCGMIGFIVPNTWLTIHTFKNLRHFILTDRGSISVINVFDKVFKDANVDNCILTYCKVDNDELKLGEIEDSSLKVWSVNTNNLLSDTCIINIGLSSDTSKIECLQKINNAAQRLDMFANVTTGLKAYQIGKGKPSQNESDKNGRIFHSLDIIDSTYGKYLKGIDVKRYIVQWSGEYISYGDWLAEPRRSVYFDKPRILVRQIPNKPPYSINAAYIEELAYNDINSMVIQKISVNPFLILSQLNSKLTSFWFINTFDKMQRKTFPQFKVNELKTFPIIGTMNSELISLCENIIGLKLSHAKTKIVEDKRSLQRLIDKTDRDIDNLVYQLYGLSDKEIQIIEDSMK